MMLIAVLPTLFAQSGERSHIGPNTQSISSANCSPLLRNSFKNHKIYNTAVTAHLYVSYKQAAANMTTVPTHNEFKLEHDRFSPHHFLYLSVHMTSLLS